MDPQQWLRDHQARGEATVRHPQEFPQQVQKVSETVTSRNRAEVRDRVDEAKHASFDD